MLYKQGQDGEQSFVSCWAPSLATHHRKRLVKMMNIIIDQAKIGVGMDDRGRNCHMVFLRGIICSFKENNGKWSVNGD